MQGLGTFGALLRIVVRLLRPAAVLHLIRSAHTNRRFVVDLLDFATASATSGRRQALESLLNRLYSKSFLGDLKDRDGDLKGIVSELVRQQPWMREQLEGTHHLGALDGLSLPGTRWQYTVLSCSLLLQIKQEYPGLRLPKGPVSKGRKVDGLEVVQAWTLLTNLGHLFGTFATERALLYELRRAPALREHFLSAIVPALRDDAAALVEKGDIDDFYYALAAYRISGIQKSAPGDSFRKAIELLASFFADRRGEVNGSRLWAFRTARQLAYHRMHMYLRAGHAIDAVHSDESVGALLPYHDFAFDPEIYNRGSTLKDMLSAIDDHHLASFFAGPQAATRVLAHLQAFQVWWRRRNISVSNFDQALAALFGRAPEDWPSEKISGLQHFVRLEVPNGGGDWQAEVASWNEACQWAPDGAFLVSPLRKKDFFLCDVYLGQPPAPILVHAVATRLAEHSYRSWTAGSPPDNAQRLWRSAARFGCQLLRLMLKPSVRPLVIPFDSGVDHRTYALVAGPDSHAALERGRAIVQGLPATAARQRELVAALDLVEQLLRVHQGPWLLFVGALELQGVEDPGPKGELDVAVCFFEREQLIWYFGEHKKAQGGGAAQLEATLSKSLTVPTDVLASVECRGGKLSVRRAVWPGPTHRAPSEAA